MLKTSVVILWVACAASPVVAETYRNLTCRDLGSDQLRAAQFIGWLNLANRNFDTQEIRFEDVQRDAQRLAAACFGSPGMPLHLAAASAFPELGQEEAGFATQFTPPSH
jgi:hypothetical protein